MKADMGARFPGVTEISVTEIPGIRIGQTENAAAGTGCTVFISEKGMRAGLDIRGGGPAARESQLLDPLMDAQQIHGILLAGGSAYGLGAANGVMECLESRGIGLPVGPMRVPLVVQSDIFDLGVGDGRVRPDAAMGFEAARLALDSPNYRDGNYGAGCGASVGKLAGRGHAMKSGIGSFALELGGLQIGAVVVLNAAGDVYDWKSGRKAAGMLKEDRSGFLDTEEVLLERTRKELEAAAQTEMAQAAAGGPAGQGGAGQPARDAQPGSIPGNTTLAVVITNACFDKARLCKIAGMAHDGYARSIRPVHTSMDGDSIYAVSVGDVKVSMDMAGSLAAAAVSEAILRAVWSAEGAYSLPGACDLGF